MGLELVRASSELPSGTGKPGSSEQDSKALVCLP